MFKIGDKVRIKTLKRLKRENRDFRNKQPYFVDNMDKYTGEFTKVANASLIDYNVQLEIDDCVHKWHPEWLEKQSFVSIDDELFEL